MDFLQSYELAGLPVASFEYLSSSFLEVSCVKYPSNLLTHCGIGSLSKLFQLLEGRKMALAVHLGCCR